MMALVKKKTQLEQALVHHPTVSGNDVTFEYLYVGASTVEAESLHHLVTKYKGLFASYQLISGACLCYGFHSVAESNEKDLFEWLNYVGCQGFFLRPVKGLAYHYTDSFNQLCKCRSYPGFAWPRNYGTAMVVEMNFRVLCDRYMVDEVELNRATNNLQFRIGFVGDDAVVAVDKVKI